MGLTLKYKFILSFVIVETIFIGLIVFLNFNSISGLSNKLIEEKIETGTKLFTQLAKVPLITYDLATLDNSVESFTKLKNVVAVKVTDKENNVLSHISDDVNIDELNKEFENITQEGRTFRLISVSIEMQGDTIGYAEILFEITESLKSIQKNKNMTYILVMLGIIISIFIAYIIGRRLTNSLSLLTNIAQQITIDSKIEIPSINSSDCEIATLSNTMIIMQERIAQQNSSLGEAVVKLQHSSNELQKERDFQNTLIDSASSVIVIMNNKGEILRANNAVTNITGYTQDELKGKMAWEVFLAKNMQANAKNIFFELISGNFPHSNENEWVSKNGSLIPFAWSNSCVKDEKGNIEYVIAVGIDITEHKKADQTIRALINSPIDSMILLSIDGTILEINEVGAKSLNSTVKDLIGKNIINYIPDTLNEQRGGYFYKVIVTKKSVKFEDVRNGYILENHLFPIIDIHGNVVQISIFSRDITEFRKAQKEIDRYSDLFDENIISSQTDKKGIIINCSKAFSKISGFSKEELIGNPHSIVRHPDMQSSLYSDMWKKLLNGEMWQGEVKNLAKDGRDYWVDARIYPDFDEDKNICGYHAIRQDITDKKMIEKLSITDQLTSLYNRRHFDDIFYKEMNRSKREKKIFCFTLLDVDNFKLYNDTYGHPMGDEVLKSISKVMKNYVKRSGDFAFRLGGEEFGIIYTVTNETDALDYAKKICKSIENEKIQHCKNTASKYVTASFGAIFVNFDNINNQETLEKEVLYAEVDKLLYEAKEDGRNKVKYHNIFD